MLTTQELETIYLKISSLHPQSVISLEGIIERELTLEELDQIRTIPMDRAQYIIIVIPSVPIAYMQITYSGQWVEFPLIPKTV